METGRERCEKQLSQNFAREVKASVNDYFEQNRLSRHANAAMITQDGGARRPVLRVVRPDHQRPAAAAVDVVLLLRHGHRHGRDRLLGHPRRPARRLFGQPARQPADRLLLRHARRQRLHLEDHPQHHPPYLYQHPRLRRGPRGLTAHPAEPAHAVQADPQIPAPVRLLRLQHGHGVLGVRQGLQVLPAAGSRALSRQEASAVRVAVSDHQQGRHTISR